MTSWLLILFLKVENGTPKYFIKPYESEVQCRKELEALQQRRCESCRYGKTTINSVICGKNGTYKEADDYCKYFEPKKQ